MYEQTFDFIKRKSQNRLKSFKNSLRSYFSGMKINQYNRSSTIKSLSDSSKKLNLKTLIWLDDLINPLDKRMDWLAYSPIGREVNVVWIKNKDQFKNWILNNGLPDGICFDHDLGDPKNNGYDCARWLIAYCKQKKLPPPAWASQSTDPEEKAKIKRFLRRNT